jgi:4-amino-4-deoxy-L-arabinose transferase-like glycosyltransferase
MPAPGGARVRLRLAAVAPALPAIALAAVLNTWALGQNGYANIYYSAGVKAMLGSWHNFFFLSADPGGLISIDKPPLGLWLQVLSAKIFGFAPLALLLPEALAGVASVAVLYVIVRPRFGTLAACAAALTLAGFPAFVAVSRDNNVDTLLILLMTLACGAALRATETGRLRELLASALLVALAFNTKALAAYLVVPGIAAGYLCCAPGPLRRRCVHLLLAGLLCGVVSFAWIAAVELTPARQRPFVGSSTNNSQLGLTFGYNGLGRARGQNGGPGAVVDREVLPDVEARRRRSKALAAALPRPAPDTAPEIAQTITAGPIAFGDSPGPLRLFGRGFGDQGAWMLAFALFGMLAIALTRPARRDPRLAGLIVFGGFLLCEAVFLSFSRGIVHPYYLSALAPGTAAIAGGGLAAMAGDRGVAMARGGAAMAREGLAAVTRREQRLTGLAILAALTAAAAQVVLLHRAHYMLIWQVTLIALALAGVLAAVVRRRISRTGLLAMFAVLLFAPTVYAASTWRKPVEGTFPAAGPRAIPGNGGAGLSLEQLATDDALIAYVLAHGGADQRFQLLTQASLTADSPILLGVRAAALGGYGGVDPALDGPALGRLVASGEARYVVLGGGYAYLGGNLASRAAARVCPQEPLSAWRGAGAVSGEGLYLLDCAGEVTKLLRQPR